MGNHFGPHKLEYIILGGGRWKDMIEAEVVFIEVDFILGEVKDGVVLLAGSDSNTYLD